MVVFYENGLKFSCKFCGACCRYNDAYVWLTRKDLKNLADSLDLSEEDFQKLYTEIFDGKIVLKSFPNGDCIFFDLIIGCKIYEARPIQCRTFPFWEENTLSKSSWEKVKKICPGVDHGELHSKEEIDKAIRESKGE